MNNFHSRNVSFTHKNSLYCERVNENQIFFFGGVESGKKEEKSQKIIISTISFSHKHTRFYLFAII